MTAPWSGSDEADGEEELAEGVGSGQERPDVLPLGRLGAVHADGHIFAGAVKFIPGVLRTHAFRLSEKKE